MEMLNEMAVFVQVADSASFTGAARHLGLTTSAVSRHVTRLEAELGGRLLQRTTRSVRLTELGEQVYAGCARMLTTAREVHTLAGSYRARPNGLVRIAAPVVFGQGWLAPRLPGFLRLFPEVSIQLVLSNRNVDLVEEGVDVAIRIARELSPGLVARTLCPMRYVLVASPGYRARRGLPGHPDELASHDCIYLGYGAFGNTWTMHPASQDSRPPARRRVVKHTRTAQTRDAVQVKVSGRASADNSLAILEMVQADGGIGVVPAITASAALREGRVVQVLPEWEFGAPHTGTVHAVYMPTPHLPLKIRALVDYLAVASESVSNTGAPL